MAEVLIRHAYQNSEFAVAFAAYSGHSVALWLLQPIRDVHDVWKFQAKVCVSDLSRS